MEMSGQLHATAALPRRKRHQHLLDTRLGGPQSRSGGCGAEKNLASVENRTQAVQPIARHHTDRAI
jgi:hypothetical protein